MRLSGNSQIARAQADAAANIQGTIGVTGAAIAANSIGHVVTNGRVRVLLDGGLVPAAGQTIYVSAATAGRATNVAPPAFQVPIGIIKDASAYAADNSVIADVSVDSGASSSSSISPVADWDLNTIRYYAVDYDNGNDGNSGFSDVSMAAAGLVAKRTWEGLLAIFPVLGAGRTVIVAIRRRAAGATYRNPANTADAMLRISGVVGYREALVRSTGDFTVPVAVVAFSNTAADKALCGYITSLVGPNVDSTFSVAAAPAPTVNTFSIAAGALTAEPVLLGDRVRFTGNVTAALVNVVGTIHENSGTQIVLLKDLGVAPAAGDTFFVEHEGVAFSDTVVEASYIANGGDLDIGNVEASLSIVGVRNTGTDITGGGVRVSGAARVLLVGIKNVQVEGRFLTLKDCSQVIMSDRYIDPGTFTAITVGAATRTMRTVAFRINEIGDSVYIPGSYLYLHTAGGTSQFFSIGSGRINGRINSGVLRVHISGLGTTGSVLGGTGPITFGSASFVERRLRVGSQIFLNSSHVAFVGVDGTGASNPIAFEGIGLRIYLQDVVGVAVGGFGVLTNSETYDCSVQVGAGVTISGPSGQFSAAGSVPGVWADLSITNVIDFKGNNWFATGIGIVPGRCVVVNNQSGVALTVGAVVRNNGVAGQVTTARADTPANSEGLLLVMVTAPANTVDGYATPIGQGAWVNFAAAPAANALSYLDNVAAGRATTTVPPVAATNQKRRLGHVLSISGTRGRVYGSPELLQVLSDGVSP